MKISRAMMRFMITPALRMKILDQNFANMKLSLSAYTPVSLGFSPLGVINHPNGIALIVYSVPCLSLPRRKSLGGIPIQNSNTLTFVNLQARKCPSSCRITNIINIAIHATIAIKVDIESKYK